MAATNLATAFFEPEPEALHPPERAGIGATLGAGGGSLAMAASRLLATVSLPAFEPRRVGRLVAYDGLMLEATGFQHPIGTNARVLTEDGHAAMAEVVGFHLNRGVLASADRGDRHDKSLYSGTDKATGGAGNSNALVGTPEQVAEALLGYVDLGVDILSARGYDTLQDAIDFGDQVIPLVRAEVARRENVAA